MKTQFLQVPEGRIAYDDAGSGPLVVCVPGMGDLRGEYRFLVPQLTAAGFRSITLDVRGHGESSVGWQDYTVAGVGSDILALIRHLNAGPAVVIGNSMAAGAAVWAAVQAPEWARALVLVGPAVRGEVRGVFRRLMGALFARPWGPAAWLRYYNGLFPSRKPADWAAYTEALRRNLAQPGRLESLQQMLFASKAASEARLGQVRQPALIVMGSRDADFKPPEAEARWVAAQVQGSCQMIEGAGHYPFSEMPELTGPKIVDFLKALPTEATHDPTNL
jgi:pimeloyl-ACP methyl ester carboxylesterase